MGQIQALFDYSNQHVSADCYPNLRLHRVLAGAVEHFDSQMLLDPLEEQFHLPALAIQVGNQCGLENEVARQKNDSFACFVFDNDTAQQCRIVLAGVEQRQYTRLIAHDIRCDLVHRVKTKGHQGLAGSGAWSSIVSLPLATSGVNPSERTASKIASRAWGSCVTVSTRCIRLNSIPVTPGIPPSLERSSPSSVGQSICMMRMGVCIPCAVNLAPVSSSGALSKGGIDGAAQQSPSA